MTLDTVNAEHTGCMWYNPSVPWSVHTVHCSVSCLFLPFNLCVFVEHTQCRQFVPVNTHGCIWQWFSSARLWVDVTPWSVRGSDDTTSQTSVKRPYFSTSCQTVPPLPVHPDRVQCCLLSCSTHVLPSCSASRTRRHPYTLMFAVLSSQRDRRCS